MTEQQTHEQEPGKADQAVRDALRGLRFGTVEITVHDGRMVEVVRKERRRLEAVRQAPAPRAV